ncbi:LTA synthase family protein [Shewanella scandinavica]|uniref:LTA synthase family protein n=1 Tax=Shewanella scandinavica TaxID=3063538 RepID=A0ABU3G3W0_9GAMM|nr:LTA synthase family protein [Shewanella sp. SP2S1-2]MDT3282340.1 LTA synthase family protein [Shewanella sp. SP2S1-2]
MKQSKFRSVLFLYISMLFILNCSRIANYIVYHDYYKETFDLLTVIFTSFRFDIMTTAYVMIIPTLLILVPGSGRITCFIKNMGLKLGLIMLLLSTLALIGDFIYFGVVNRHTFSDLPLLMTETSFVLPFLMKDHFALTIFSVATIAIIIILLVKKYRLFFYHNKNHKTLASQIGVFVIAIPILILFLRGLNLHGKPLGIIDAYKNQSEQQANLILNGIYTGGKGTTQNFKRTDYKFFNSEELKQQLNKTEDEAYKYPYVSQFSENTPNGRNLVIILVEALSYAYIDGLSGSDYKVTPFLDELSKKAEVYDNFYAVAQRSNLGVQASLFGIPPLESVGYIGGGLELSRLTKIGNIAQAHGYQTQMLQSSKRDSIRLDSIANYAGFQQYLGRSDIPITRTDYPDPDGAQFGWDYEMLMKTLELANEKTKPFISFSFTGTTHMPYVETPKHLQVYPYGQDTFTDFLNTVRYTDESLKAFFAEASKQDWYENTTFMILADHTLFKTKTPGLESAFHIPLWIYRPGQNIPPKRHKILASQLDILPTAFDLLGFNDEFASVGRSLYRERKPYSIVVKGDLLGAFTNSGSFLIAGDKIISENESVDFIENQAPKYAEQLKLEFQLSQQAVLNNTWVK